MHFSLTLLALTFITTMAAPIEENAVGDYSYRDGWSQTEFPIVNLTESEDKSSDLSKRQAYGGPGYRAMYYCNWGYFLLGGGCREDTPKMGTCYNTPACFTDDMNSVKLGDQMQCDFFDNRDCNSNQGTLAASTIKTGTQALENYGWADRIASYRCYPGNPPA